MSTIHPMTDMVHACAQFYAIAHAPDGECVVIVDTWHDNVEEIEEHFGHLIAENCRIAKADRDSVRWVTDATATPHDKAIIDQHWRTLEIVEHRAATKHRENKE